MFRDVSSSRFHGAISAELVEKMIDVLQQPDDEDTEGLSPAVIAWLRRKAEQANAQKSAQGGDQQAPKKSQLG